MASRKCRKYDNVSVRHYPGVAFWVRSVSGADAWVTMFGDDRVLTVSVRDLSPLKRDEFCASCGQIGCCHG